MSALVQSYQVAATAVPTPVTTIVVQSAPGTPVWVSGMFVLGAAIFGAGIAFLSTYLSDKRRSKDDSAANRDRVEREKRERWDDIVRGYCTDLLGATLDISVLGGEQWRLVWFLRLPGFRKRMHLLFGIVHVHSAFTAAYLSVRRVREIRDAANYASALVLVRPALAEHADALLRSCQYSYADNDETHEAAVENYRAKRVAFVEQVRIELDVIIPS